MKNKENSCNTKDINDNTIIKKDGNYYNKINDKINNILNYDSYYKSYHCNFENYNIYKYFNNDMETYKKEWMKNSILRQMIASGIGMYVHTYMYIYDYIHMYRFIYAYTHPTKM
jgi:hypothetical protein